MNSDFHGITRTLPVRFDDLDGGGILYHARFVALLDHAIYDFWREAGWDFTGDAVPVVRALQFDYLAPVASVGPIEVQFAITHRGRSSVTYAFAFRRGDVVHAQGTRTNVFVDRDGRPASIPVEAWTIARGTLFAEEDDVVD